MEDVTVYFLGIRNIFSLVSFFIFMNKEGGKNVIFTDNTTYFSLYQRSKSLGVSSPDSSHPYLKLVIDWKDVPRLCVLCFMGYKIITPLS